MNEYIIVSIFIFTYIIISIRRLGVIRVERPAIALFGGLLMILIGAISVDEAIKSIDINTISLLLGMMIIVCSLEISGFFNWAAVCVTKFARTQRDLLILVVCLTAVLSALFLNDAVVLMLTPIVVKVAKKFEIDPTPYLVGEAIASNIGSVATPIGNPQNAYIASISGIPFVEFIIYLLPIAVISLIVELLVLLVVFRKELRKPLKNIERNFSIKEEYHREITNKGLFKLSIVIFSLVFAGFVFSDTFLPISVIAIAGGAAMLVLSPVICKVDIKETLNRVDWGILLFFSGLFILLASVEKTFLVDILKKFFIQNPTILNLSLATTLISNLISNVPAVILLAPINTLMDQKAFYITLSATSTLAGNATLFGAAANIIVAECALKHGVELRFKKFLVAGLPITILTIGISIVYLEYLF